MAATAKRTNPELWERVKAEVRAGDKGGDPGEWSARKAQMAVAHYKQAGGGYEGRKAADNHLSQWTHEEWDTKSGGKSKDTGERYLPKRAREALTDDEYDRSSVKKREDTAEGKQHSAQPADVAAKTADARLADLPKADLPKAELMQRAAKHGVAGRSRMTKDQLVAALGHHA